MSGMAYIEKRRGKGESPACFKCSKKSNNLRSVEPGLYVCFPCAVLSVKQELATKGMNRL